MNQYLIAIKYRDRPNHGWGNTIIDFDHKIGENDAEKDFKDLISILSAKTGAHEAHIVVLSITPLPI